MERSDTSWKFRNVCIPGGYLIVAKFTDVNYYKVMDIRKDSLYHIHFEKDMVTKEKLKPELQEYINHFIEYSTN